MNNSEIRKLTDVVVAVRREADERARIEKTKAGITTALTYSYLRHADLVKRKQIKAKTSGKGS